LAELCVRYGVSRLELFGSGSRADFDVETSDLDLLVEFADPRPEGAFDRYFGLKGELERVFQRRVDLVEARAIRNPYFRQAIEQDKVLVYAA
jgi:predicted nucleotidyltransferase